MIECRSSSPPTVGSASRLSNRSRSRSVISCRSSSRSPSESKKKKKKRSKKHKKQKSRKHSRDDSDDDVEVIDVSYHRTPPSPKQKQLPKNSSFSAKRPRHISNSKSDVAVLSTSHRRNYRHSMSTLDLPVKPTDDHDDSLDEMEKFLNELKQKQKSDH